MILVDTSIWVDHFHRGDPHLAQTLEDGLVLMHPMVLGEIACGNLQRRSEILGNLQQLPPAVPAEHSEVMHFMERHKLYASGLGFIDMHLLASALLTHCRFWTRDSRLANAAASLKIAFSPR
jgi:predicted nucleic acid-binding protein